MRISNSILRSDILIISEGDSYQKEICQEHWQYQYFNCKRQNDH